MGKFGLQYFLKFPFLGDIIDIVLHKSENVLMELL